MNNNKEDTIEENGDDYSSLDSDNNNITKPRSTMSGRSQFEDSFSDSDESKSESETDFPKKLPFTYFLPINDIGLVQFKQAQSECMSTWIHVDVFKRIHTEVNTDRFKCQIRHLTLAMVEGNKWNLRFEEKLFSNPIVTWVPSAMKTSNNQIICQLTYKMHSIHHKNGIFTTIHKIQHRFCRM